MAPVLSGLLRSCHPIPTAAVTALSAGLAALAGVGFGAGALLVAAVLTGQLSIGWSNDRIDAVRDSAVARTGKPVAAGDVSLRTVTLAAVLALIATVGFSVGLGWPAGAAALVVVICGWAYNLGLKGSALSFVPYAIAFGTLPAAATLAAPGNRWPAVWALLAGALLGVSAHLANVLPDLAQDAATGVRGFPHRLGARRVAVGAPLLLFCASVVIVWAPGSGSSPGWRWLVLLPVAAVAVVAARAGSLDPGSRVLFLATLLVAGSDLVLFAVSGGRLT